jgi:hypothetical protein
MKKRDDETKLTKDLILSDSRLIPRRLVRFGGEEFHSLPIHKYVSMNAPSELVPLVHSSSNLGPPAGHDDADTDVCCHATQRSGDSWTYQQLNERER